MYSPSFLVVHTCELLVVEEDSFCGHAAGCSHLNRTVARGGRLTDVETLIPDENGSENALMVMWRGVTRLCCVPGSGRRVPPMRSGFPARQYLCTRRSLIPSWLGGAGGYQMDYENPKAFTKPEQVTLSPQRRPNTQAMTPDIKMFVSDRFIDQLGNKARIIKARD